MEIKNVFLNDVAKIEQRPTKGKIYPQGTIIIQIAVSKGQVLYLRTEAEIEDKYAVILPRENIEPFYLFCVIEKHFPIFFERHKQGLNFKAEDLQRFSFPFHQNQTDREVIGKIMRCFGCNEFY